jgi:hypothetical protein
MTAGESGALAGAADCADAAGAMAEANSIPLRISIGVEAKKRVGALPGK